MYEECFNDEDIKLCSSTSMLDDNLIYVEYIIKQEIEEKYSNLAFIVKQNCFRVPVSMTYNKHVIFLNYLFNFM